ncbi:MAG TPA: hypothetical protein VN328_11280, partial [Thermodesulfovibrionales bacterium]|nr:hypothetical protein [Thermodesulfovibrionales bacterium]
ISVSQETLDNSKKAKEANEKLQKAKDLVAQGKLDEGITMAEDASKLAQKNSAAVNLAAKWRKEKETLVEHIGRMKKLVEDGKLPEAEKERSVAKNLHPKYQPVMDAENLLRAKTDEAKEKRAKARKLREEGEALQKQSKLEEAVRKYRESLTYVPDKALEEHIRQLEAKIADMKKSQSAANALWEEGRVLSSQDKPGDALTKFNESLKIWSSPDRVQYVKDFEARINQRKADAKKLRAEGETLQNQKRYDEAINKYRASLKLWPDPKLEAYIKDLEALAAKEKGKKETADRLWNDGKALYDQKRMSDALSKFKESLTYWQDQTRAEYVKKMETEKAKAKKLREEGEQLQNQGKIPDAVAKYRESLKYWPDSALEGHIAGLEANVRDQQDRKAAAKRLRDEGYALQQRGLIREAITKYTESLAYWPDADLEKHIRQLETKLAQDPVKPPPPVIPPQPVTSFDPGRVWRVKQWIGKESWTWVWTRKGDSNSFDAVARHDQKGIESRHAIEFISAKGGQVILSRPDAYGKYIGTLSEDGTRVVSGIMDSISHSDQGWTATIEGGQSKPVAPVPASKPSIPAPIQSPLQKLGASVLLNITYENQSGQPTHLISDLEKAGPNNLFPPGESRFTPLSVSSSPVHFYAVRNGANLSQAEMKNPAASHRVS